ncbi:hypothetical protein EPN52_02890 [bacterium]|nr:MAG: hypothetical protein EPN52_02890 [bacterium]
MEEVAEATLHGAWLEDGPELSAAGRWRFLADGTFTFARESEGVRQQRRGDFRLETLAGRAVLKLTYDERTSAIPVRLNRDRLEMLVRSGGANVVRAYCRGNTRDPALRPIAQELVGRWERSDTRHDEMIGEFYEFAGDGSFIRVEGFHRNLTGEMTTTFQQLSVRSGIYVLERVEGGVRLSFDLDGQLRSAGVIRLEGSELTLEGPRPLRLLRRVSGPPLRHRQEAG